MAISLLVPKKHVSVKLLRKKKRSGKHVHTQYTHTQSPPANGRKIHYEDQFKTTCTYNAQASTHTYRDAALCISIYHQQYGS